MDEGKSYLANILGYLQGSFRKTNGNQSYGLYGAPKSNIILDKKTPSAGYQPIKNSDIYMNPNRNNSQYSMLETLFHEAAHTQQPRLAQMFNFSDPLYRQLNDVNFPYYDAVNEHPRAEEILATMRAQEALLPAGKVVYDDSMGQDVIEQLRKSNPNMSEQQLKLRLDGAMFPGRNFAYPIK